MKENEKVTKVLDNVDFILPVFSPTMKLRWLEYNQRIESVGLYGDARVVCDTKLQQLWQSSNGIYEWRDIEIETI